MLPSILERAQIQSTESISVEKSIYNGFPFLESNKLWIASSSNPCEQCPPSATFCTISIRCWSGAALFDPTRSHTPLYNHQPARKESHFPHGDGQRIPGTGQPGTFQCDKSSQSQQLFFVLLISMQVWSRQFQSVSSRSGSTITPKPRVSHNS